MRPQRFNCTVLPPSAATTNLKTMALSFAGARPRNNLSLSHKPAPRPAAPKKPSTSAGSAPKKPTTSTSGAKKPSAGGGGGRGGFNLGGLADALGPLLSGLGGMGGGGGGNPMGGGGGGNMGGPAGNFGGNDGGADNAVDNNGGDDADNFDPFDGN
jgi:hypothetical protein